MTPNHRHPTAKIYTFPPRTAAIGGEHSGLVRHTAEQHEQQFPVVEFGSGWYHDAAVQEAARSRKS